MTQQSQAVTQYLLNKQEQIVLQESVLTDKDYLAIIKELEIFKFILGFNDKYYSRYNN